MLNLLQIEWIKLKSNKTFWILIILFIGIQGLVFYGLDSFKLSFNGEADGPGATFDALNVFKHPNIWQYFGYMAGFFKIVLAVLLIQLLNNEFEYRTYRQHIIDGLSREQNFMLKVLIMKGLAIFSVLFLILMVFVFGTNPDEVSFLDKFDFAIGLFIENLGFLAFAFVLTHFIKKTGLVLGILLLWALAVEPIIHYKYPDIGNYLPLQVFSDLIDMPFISLINNQLQENVPVSQLLLAIGYIYIFSGIAYLKVKRSDL